MFKVVDAPTRGVQRVRPRMRNVGLVHVVAAVVLAAALALGAMHGLRRRRRPGAAPRLRRWPASSGWPGWR